MGDRRSSSVMDLARQVLNVVGAILQVAAGAVVGRGIGTVSDELRSLIVPAGYAFAIWTPIFALLGAYAVFQALPAYRSDPLFRRLGWFTGLAMTGNGVWSFLFPNRLFVAAQIVIIGLTVCAGIAFLRYVAATHDRPLTPVERWVVGPGLGLYFGWVTAATVVGLAATLVSQGFARDGTGAGVGGAALLLAGGFVAFVVILYAKRGPTPAWVAYGAAVLWALAAVVANQYDDSVLTSAAAIATAVLVLIALVGPFAARPSAPGPLHPAGSA